MSRAEAQKRLNPYEIHSLMDFEWISKLLAEGFLHGKHFSHKLGTGQEFQQYRAYVPGDDVRSIDWKMFAKTDKYYIRQANIETEHQFITIIDNSLSMNYEEANTSKLMYAKLLVAAITRVLAIQGDYFSWQSNSKSCPNGNGLRHWHNSLGLLYELEAEHESRFVDPMSYTDTTFLWLSDFYQSKTEIENYLKKLKTPKTELITFNLIGRNEKNLDFPSHATFIDLETKQKKDLDPTKIKNHYQHKLNSHHHSVKNLCYRNGAFYQELYINDPIREGMEKFMNHYNYLGSL